jgi:signal peptidase I
MAAADESPKRSTILEYFEAFLIALIFVNFARIFVFQAFKIPTGSMEDNLKIGDHLIVNKCIYGPPTGTLLDGIVPVREPKRGDIIVFRYPEQPKQDFVKRVIGLPGETLMIRDKKVYIDGKLLDEPYVIHADPTVYPGRWQLPEPYRSRDHLGPVTIGPNEYFAMGDNRDQSHDSRYWGPVARSMIKGRAFMIYWSFDGAPPGPGSPPEERVRELANVVRHFFTKTRWDRTFFIVDSKYHFTPGISSYGNE